MPSRHSVSSPFLRAEAERRDKLGRWMKRWMGFEGPASITCQSPKLVPLHLQPAPLFPLLFGRGERSRILQGLVSALFCQQPCARLSKRYALVKRMERSQRSWASVSSWSLSGYAAFRWLILSQCVGLKEETRLIHHRFQSFAFHLLQ